jgi:hypothetical protein
MNWIKARTELEREQPNFSRPCRGQAAVISSNVMLDFAFYQCVRVLFQFQTGPGSPEKGKVASSVSD